MKTTFNLITLLLALLLAPGLRAQNLSVSGKVTDAATHEAISYVNVHIKDTNLGVTADSTGSFTVNINPQHAVIEISVIGYEHKFIKVQPNAKFIAIELKPAKLDLKEVIVKPGKRTKRAIDTAALFVLARVIENKQANNPAGIDSYYLHEHTKLVTSMIHASPKLLNSKVLKPFGFFFEQRDTTFSGEEYIPLAIMEEYNETYHRAQPQLNRKVIYYRHLSGFKQSFIANYLADQFKSIDVYKNVYVMAGKAFTSPFSPQARSTYTYHILDTIRQGNNVSYTLNFVARNKEDVALKGYAIVDSATWAIAAIHFKPNEKSNVNFLTDYSIDQKFENEGEGWVMKGEQLNARGNLLEQKQKLAVYITKTTARDSVQLNHPIPANVSHAADDIVIKNAYKRPRTFLDSLRISPLDGAEQHIYHAFDTALTVKAFHRLQWLGKLVTSANFRVGPLDFGRAYYLVSRNAVEGYRVRLGVFTNDYFSRTIYLYGQAAYGFTDKRWKYEADAHIKLPSYSNRWNELWLQSKNDMVVLGQDNPLLSYDNILTLISPGSKYNKVMHTSSQSLQYQTDWFKGFSSNVGVSFNRFYSTTRGFMFQQMQDNALKQLSGFNTTEVSAELRYCANDQYSESYGYRYFIPTTKPSFTLKYTWGVKSPTIGDYGYHKLQATVRDIIYMPIIGYGKLLASGGYIFGQSPYPVSFISSSNIGIFRDETSYQLTNLFEFAHDKYVSLWYEQHFEGLLFNHIPYVKKLKLREFITAKALWGDMSSKNRSILALPDGMQTAAKVPYVEVGFGIENVLKILQVSFTWRATYRDVPSAPNFAVKLAIKPSF